MHSSLPTLKMTPIRKWHSRIAGKVLILVLLLGMTAGCVTEDVEDIPAFTQSAHKSIPSQTAAAPTATILPSPTHTQPPALRPTSTNIPSPIATYRPLNGEILDDQRGDPSDFLGELSVDNGTANDGLVVIAWADGAALVAFYVRAESTFTLTGIPDGNYWVYVASGQNWDETTHQMVTVLNYERFDDMFLFETDASSYTTWSITLHPVPEGQANTEPVDPADFPVLGGT